MLVLFFVFLAALVVLIVGLTHLSVWVGNREPENEEEQDRRRDEEKKKRHSEPYKTGTDAITARLESISDELYADGKQDRRHQRKRALLEVSGLVAAIAAAVGAFWSAWIFSGQLEEMRLENRPWISIEDVKISGPLVINKGYPFLSIAFHLNNKGKSPATNVTISLHAYAAGLDPQRQETQTCHPKRGEGAIITESGAFKIDYARYGILVFPGDAPTLPWNGNIDLLSKRPVSFISTIVGCVIYKFSPEGEDHRTGFIWNLTGLLGPIVLKDGSIPADELSLTKNIIGDFAD